jgi:Fis family transcriptional regulator
MLQDYFSTLEGEPAQNIYHMVLSAIEKPMIQIVLEHAQGNESRAAQWLGIHRLTLRKLRRKYALSRH